jgi:hypothetical protein
MAPPSDDEWLELIDKANNLTKKSKASYKKHIRALQKVCGEGHSLSHIMMNFDSLHPRLERLEPSVLRNHLIIILALFKRGEHNQMFRRCDPRIHEQYTKWLNANAHCATQHRKRLDDNLPSEREIEAAASLSEWRDAHEQMQAREKGSQAALLIAFQTLALPPLRGSDLSHIRIGEQLTGNYIRVRHDGSGELVIRDHKTARYFPRLERYLPQSLVRMVEESVKQQPRNWLFSTRHGSAYSNNGFLAWKSSVFRRAFNGRPVTSNSLRHAYITEHVGGLANMSTNQARDIASAMGHTLSMQRQYVRLPLRARF